MRPRATAGLVFVLAFLIALATASASAAAPQPGTLDPGFGGLGGTPGLTTVAQSGTGFVVQAGTVDPTGRIVVVGDTPATQAIPDGRFFVARFTPDGQPDTSFGAGTGRVILDVSGFTVDARAVLVTPTGQILVAGGIKTTGTANLQFWLGVVGPNGDLQGTHSYDIASSSSEEAFAIARQPADGKLVLAGGGSVAGDSQWAIMRVSGADFTLDSSFDADGKVLTDWNPANDIPPEEEATEVAVLGSGRIAVAGTELGPAGDATEGALAYYEVTNGSIVPGVFGRRTLTFPGMTSPFSAGIVATPSDQVILAVSGFREQPSQGGGTPPEFALVRFTPEGRLDTSFGTGGLTITGPPTPTATVSARGLALAPDGKLVVGGVRGDGPTESLLAARYLANGLPDPGFGSGGLASVAMPHFTFGEGVATVGGRVVTVGFEETAGLADAEIALAGFRGGDDADVSVGLDAPATTLIAGQTAQLALRAANQGPDPAGDVVAHVKLPPGLELTHTATTGADSCSGTSTVSCTLPAVQAGDARTVTLTVKLLAAGEQTANADAAGSVFDPAGGDDTASATLHVAPGPPPPDRTPPKLTLKAPRTSPAALRRHRQVKVRVTVSEAAGVDLTLSVHLRRGRRLRTVPLAAAHTDLGRAGRRTVTLQLTATGAIALARVRHAPLKLVARATDRAGNSRSVTLKL